MNGGKRPGAGRKPKAEKYKSAIITAEEKIRDKLPFVVDKLLELADGIQIQDINSKGEEVIYSRPPDRQALEYLANRIMGKPVEQVSNDNTGEINVTVKYV